ncbi:hypothetical protein I550_2616 [Mycobacterium intracellulare 1956]|uniref:Uncharacterized protein n=1 Tax=Mycobacterium intracellulare 1956 TaxID=1299331 RepID=X8CVH9_MYCIT|nr:hypothetical protein I550_2616 [Mycobacterium intracellulare 1956]
MRAAHARSEDGLVSEYKEFSNLRVRHFAHGKARTRIRFVSPMVHRPEMGHRLLKASMVMFPRSPDSLVPLRLRSTGSRTLHFPGRPRPPA